MLMTKIGNKQAVSMTGDNVQKDSSARGLRKWFNRENAVKCAPYLIVGALCLLSCIDPVFAATGAENDIKTILQKMINIIKLIFSAIGVILAAYAVGMLALSFKNEDADSKSRASTLLIVAIVLIAIGPMIDQLKLVDNIK